MELTVLPLGKWQRKGGRDGRGAVGSRQHFKSKNNPHSYLPLPCLTPHPPPPPPAAWHWTTRELEGGRMCLSPPSVKTCHYESMQWFDATCWRDLWTAQFIPLQVLGPFCSAVKSQRGCRFKLFLSLHNVTIAQCCISLSQKMYYCLF